MSLLQPVRRARTRSLWLQEALSAEPDAERAEPLSGGHRTDVCIVGGGYTGLWTALQIKWRDPSVDVMMLEADICGAGASGRNGGFATSWWMKRPSLIAKYGEEESMRLARASEEAVVEIGRVCKKYGIDADYRPGGVLETATTPAQIGDWDDAVQAARAHGVDVFTALTPAEVARRSGSPVHGPRRRHLGSHRRSRAAGAPGARPAPGRAGARGSHLGAQPRHRGVARPAAHGADLTRRGGRRQGSAGDERLARLIA
jgi:hypothetical protein